MTRAAYTDLFLTFTPAAAGGGITQTTITSLITNLYREAAAVLDISDDTELDSNEPIKAVIIRSASNIINAWNASKNGIPGAVQPTFGLSDQDKDDIVSKTWTFRFANHEDINVIGTGDGY